jgi:hypothetical protein
MLPGWEASHGARLELTVASAVGLKVLWPDVSAGTREGEDQKRDEEQQGA